jgi:hypothetical protein
VIGGGERWQGELVHAIVARVAHTRICEILLERALAYAPETMDMPGQNCSLVAPAFENLLQLLQKRMGHPFVVERQRFISSGGDMLDISADNLDAFVKGEYDKWTALIHDAGVTLD